MSQTIAAHFIDPRHNGSSNYTIDKIWPRVLKKDTFDERPE